MIEEKQETSSLAQFLKKQGVSIKQTGSNGLMKLMTQTFKGMLQKIDLSMVEKITFNILKTKRKELPLFARIYIYINKKFVNQVAFMTDIKELQNIKQEMESGHRRMFCDLEKAMIKDIKNYVLMQSFENQHLLGGGRKTTKFQKQLEENLTVSMLPRT